MAVSMNGTTAAVDMIDAAKRQATKRRLSGDFEKVDASGEGIRERERRLGDASFSNVGREHQRGGVDEILVERRNVDWR